MKNKIKALLLLMAVSISFGLGVSAQDKINKVKSSKVKIEKAVVTPSKIAVEYQPASSLEIVASPTKYLNKKVKIKAKFDKFSTLGLDYKPAFKSSEKYITFLIKRDDVVNHTVPLSEMKNFLLRDEAEKYIDLAPGDEIEFSGNVFSDALGDTWFEVDKFVVLTQKSKEKKIDKK